MKYFILFFLLGITPFAFSNPYERHIQQINRIDSSTVEIVLNDHSVWPCYLGASEWQLGDSICFDRSFFSNSYYFKNLRNQESKNIPFLPSQELLAPLRLLKKSGDGLLLQLDDQSIWFTGYTDSWSTESWKEGERLILIPSTDLKGHYLFNLDCQEAEQTIYARYAFNQEEMVYRHFIKAIHFDKQKDTCHIQLDNDFVLEARRPFLGFSDDAFLDWKVGDPVCIQCEAYNNSGGGSAPPTRHITLDLINLNTLQKHSVKYSQQKEAWSGTKITKIERLYKFFNYICLITLEDGSYWKFDQPDYHADEWEVGDRILISPKMRGLHNLNRYCLVNPDRGMRPASLGFTYYAYSVAQGRLTKMIEAPESRENN